MIGPISVTRKNDKHIWSLYREKLSTVFNKMIVKATADFVEKCLQKIGMKKTDRILDLGCGPGVLVDKIINKCKLIYGIDISDKYIDYCKQKFSLQKYIKFSVVTPFDNEAYNKIIIDYKINKVIICSVFQYYNNLDEIKKILKTFAEIAKYQSFSCLIADLLPEDSSLLTDVIDVVKNAIKEQYFFIFIKFVCYQLAQKITKKNHQKLLEVPSQFFISLASELNFNFQIIPNLTLYSNRYMYSSILIKQNE